MSLYLTRILKRYRLIRPENEPGRPINQIIPTSEKWRHGLMF